MLFATKAAETLHGSASTGTDYFAVAGTRFIWCETSFLERPKGMAIFTPYKSFAWLMNIAYNLLVEYSTSVHCGDILNLHVPEVFEQGFLDQAAKLPAAIIHCAKIIEHQFQCKCITLCGTTQRIRLSKSPK